MRNFIDITKMITEGYDRNVTIKTYGERLEKAVKDDTFASISSAEDILKQLEEADPTPKKAFVLTLVRWYLEDSMHFLEDAPKATDAFVLYSRFRNRPNMPKLSDLNFYEFLNLGDDLAVTKSKKEENKDEELLFYKNNQAELKFDNDEWKVVIPKTENAAKYFGRNTRWCTSADNHNMFNSYNNDGPLYIILEKKTNTRWQFHFESSQFMDEKDYDISDYDTMVRILYGPMNFIWQNGKQVLTDTNLLQYVKEPSKEMIKKSIRKMPSYLKYLPYFEWKPFANMPYVVGQKSFENMNHLTKDDVVEIAKFVLTANEEDKRAGTNILYIPNPSLELQKHAIDNGALLSDMRNEHDRLAIHDDLWIYAFTKKPKLIYGDGMMPTEVLKYAAKNGLKTMYAQFMRQEDNIPEYIKILALENEPKHSGNPLVYYLDRPSEECQMAALKRNPTGKLKDVYYVITNPSKKAAEYFFRETNKEDL